MHSLAFEKAYIDYSTLHVPASAVDAYRAVAPWSEFGTVVAIDDPTGIKGISVDANQPTVTYSVNGQVVPNDTKGLHIKNGKKVIVK